MRLDVEVLKSTFTEELEGGAIKANARVAESLCRKLLAKDVSPVTATIFWLKSRACWKETSVHEHARR